MKTHPKHRLEDAAGTIHESCSFEQQAWLQNQVICGVDEAGRGCMAGPVVVAAAILYPNIKHPLLIDSKLLKKQELAYMYEWLQDKCFFSIGIASNRIIDQYNIYQTTAKCMRNTILHVLTSTPKLPSLIAIDAMPLHINNTPYESIEIISMIKGESKSISIAAASILAKVTRDKIMMRLEQTFPGYLLATHKGYCTKLHQQKVKHLRPTIIHRNSYLSWLKESDTNEQKTIFC